MLFIFLQFSMYGLLCLEAKVCSNGQSVCKLSLLQYVRKVQPSQLCSQKEMTLTVALMAVGAPDPKPTLDHHSLIES